MGSDGKPRAMNKFDAVVFDMDGTITDTEKIYNHYWFSFLRE